MAKKKSRLNSEECKQAIFTFSRTQDKYNAMQTKFSRIKSNFYDDMEDYFKNNDVCGKLTLECDNAVDGVKRITVTRVQNTKIEFDADKLEKVLGKELSRGVITKHYEVIDMDGLIMYLKDYGINPKTFKKFIAIRKTVNPKELDKLEELGKITANQIKGCYTAKTQDPYFKVKIGRGKGDD